MGWALAGALVVAGHGSAQIAPSPPGPAETGAAVAAAAATETPAAATETPAVATEAAPAGVRVLPTGGLDMEGAALLLSGQQGGLLPLAVFASPLGPAAGGAATVVVIEVEGSALLAPATDRKSVV